MLLSSEDIGRLERKGYGRDFFILDEQGYPTLRNLDNHCVFLNVENQKCIVYHSRPLGCRLYPVIYDERRGIIIDHTCRAKVKLGENQMARRGWKVIRLLERIDAEAKIRHKYAR